MNDSMLSSFVPIFNARYSFVLVNTYSEKSAIFYSVQKVMSDLKSRRPKVYRMQQKSSRLRLFDSFPNDCSGDGDGVDNLWSKKKQSID